jgi:FtsP/CotA-like multicopper oxidase with cupredoxin domain
MEEAMTSTHLRHSLSRRALLTGGAGALGTAMVIRAVGPQGSALGRTRPVAGGNVRRMHLVGTDGWVSMPAGSRADPPFYPDALAPPNLDTYVFGFRNVSDTVDHTWTADEVAAVRGHAQISAPILEFDEEDEIYLTLTNLGLSMRPDLDDGHTLHWHGFVNAIPLFDGVPELSLAVPIGRDFTYYYKPHDAGTYMYHCHFEDVEHVQMGMTGMVFVRPKQNNIDIAGHPAGTATYAYNDGDGSTRYDREFSFMLTELWSAAHYRDAHIQVSDWTDYKASFWLMNGRGYPDTLQPNTDPLVITGDPRLQYQPISSMVRCNTGDRVLLRMSNLGFQNHAMTVDNVDLTIVAKDASLLRGRDGTTNYVTTNTVEIGPGESRDVLFTAPQAGEYLLYDRTYAYASNGGGGGYGGMATKIVVENGTAPAQTGPNT